MLPLLSITLELNLNISPAAFQKQGEKTRVTQTTSSQGWWVTTDSKAQAVMPHLHETSLAESIQASEVDPSALENKKLHPLESHLRKKRKF